MKNNTVKRPVEGARLANASSGSKVRAGKLQAANRRGTWCTKLCEVEEAEHPGRRRDKGDHYDFNRQANCQVWSFEKNLLAAEWRIDPRMPK